jgi:hypothetical protein
MWNLGDLAMTGWVQILVGAVLLLLGRRLFWVFVGAVGFIVGAQIATRFFAGQTQLVLLLIAIGCGLVGALLAVVLQRLAVFAAGFFAGGYLGLRLAETLQLQPDLMRWVLFFVGAMVVAVLLSVLFDWVLIVLSALTGAVLVAEMLPLDRTLAFAAAAVLFLIGAAVQSRTLRRREPATRAPA